MAKSTAAYPVDSPFTAIGGLGDFVVIVTGLILLIFIRGRARTRSATDATARTSA